MFIRAIAVLFLHFQLGPFTVQITKVAVTLLISKCPRGAFVQARFAVYLPQHECCTKVFVDVFLCNVYKLVLSDMSNVEFISVAPVSGVFLKSRYVWVYRIAHRVLQIFETVCVCLRQDKRIEIAFHFHHFLKIVTIELHAAAEINYTLPGRAVFNYSAIAVSMRIVNDFCYFVESLVWLFRVIPPKEAQSFALVVHETRLGFRHRSGFRHQCVCMCTQDA